MLLDTNELIHKALEFKGQVKDLDIALKYALMAVMSTWSPRADACCVTGEIYLERGNYAWSKFWYEKAINNMCCGVDEELPNNEYFTTIPMLKLGYIEYKTGNAKGALEYFEAVLNIEPDNEIALENAEEIKKTLQAGKETCP